MNAFLGKNQNTDDYKSKRDLFYAPIAVKNVQHILAQDAQVDQRQWQLLSQELYKVAVKSSLGAGDFLREATRVVIDWNSNFEKVSFAVIKGYFDMKTLLTWQKEFILLLQNQENTSEIYLFKPADDYTIWVIVDNPSTDQILTYSKLYTDFLHQHSELYFEFLVFGEDEINKEDLPDDTVSFSR